ESIQAGLSDAGDPVRAVRVGIGVEKDERNDLTEAERNDRQVIPPQAKGRGAKQEAEDGGHERAYHDHDPEGCVQPRIAGRSVRHRVRADCEERCIPEVEQPGQADHDVEADGEKDEDARVVKATDEVFLRPETVERRDQHDQRQHDRGDGHPERDRQRLVSSEELAGGSEALPESYTRRGHARSANCCPRMPVGRKMRTRISVPNTAASLQRPYPNEEASTSMNPITNPPIAAPVVLPMPPSTAAVNAFRPAWKPIWKCVTPK